MHVALEFMERRAGAIGRSHLKIVNGVIENLDFNLGDGVCRGADRPRLVYSRHGLSGKERAGTLLFRYGARFFGYNLVEKDGQDMNIVVMRTRPSDHRLSIQSGACSQFFFGGLNADRILILNDLTETLQIRSCEDGTLVQQFDGVKVMVQVGRNALAGHKGNKVKLFFETSDGWVRRKMATHVPRPRLLLLQDQPHTFVVSNGRERQAFTLTFDGPSSCSSDSPAGLRYTHRGTQPCTWATSPPPDPVTAEDFAEVAVAKRAELAKDGWSDADMDAITAHVAPEILRDHRQGALDFLDHTKRLTRLNNLKAAYANP